MEYRLLRRVGPFLGITSLRRADRVVSDSAGESGEMVVDLVPVFAPGDGYVHRRSTNQ